jgi:hypothetical protein
MSPPILVSSSMVRISLNRRDQLRTSGGLYSRLFVSICGCFLRMRRPAHRSVLGRNFEL